MLLSPLLSAILFCALATYMSINSKSVIRVKKWKFILQTSLCLELLAVYVGRILPGCGILRLHEVKRPETSSGMRHCAPEITEGE